MIKIILTPTQTDYKNSLIIKNVLVHVLALINFDVPKLRPMLKFFTYSGFYHKDTWHYWKHFLNPYQEQALKTP